MSTGAASGFENFTWGMTIDDVAAVVGPATRLRNALTQRREIAGVPCNVAWELGPENRLFSISITPLQPYRGEGEGHGEHSALIEWLTERLGPPTERSGSGATWLLPTAKVWTHLDESLGVYFEVPE